MSTSHATKLNRINQPIIPWGFFFWYGEHNEILSSNWKVSKERKYLLLAYLWSCENISRRPSKNCSSITFDRIFDYIFCFFNTIAVYKTYLKPLIRLISGGSYCDKLYAILSVFRHLFKVLMQFFLSSRNIRSQN